MEKYNPKEIESKWQKYWEKNKTFEIVEDSDKEKFYGLVEFPYPSGAGLHVGHPRSYTAMDVICRKRRMEGRNVLFPMGFDAFGLPTENFAIKTGRPPAEVTAENIANFTRQLKSLGFSFDWSRAVDTTDPNYYKWTQWIFLQLFKHGLAYKKKQPINWCPKDKIGLANEEVVNGCCERCGTAVEKREKEQWMLAITKYADSLLEGLKAVNYIPQARIQQDNWIGRSEGVTIAFSVRLPDGQVQRLGFSIDVFTTRPDTIFGATYLVVAPEHPMIGNLKLKIENWKEVEAYIEDAKRKTDIERSAVDKDLPAGKAGKTGVELKGVKAVNPANGEEIPVWVADFVLGGYGTGAVFADAHDERDFAFAKKYDIPLKITIRPDDEALWEHVKNLEECYTGDGVHFDSNFLDGLRIPEAKERIIQWLEEKGVGKRQVQYKLRDWVFSRQRYWGEPIPLVYCNQCVGWIPLPEDQLPLKLPNVEKYQPTDTGESPLAVMIDWVQTTCPKCGGVARRETDTMPNWAGSSWYFLRYMDPHNSEALASRDAMKYWGQVDWYNGGMEHTVLHLLYSRFWNQFLYDIGVVPVREPYAKRTSHGLIMGPDGEKMSKSRGNVVNPDEVVAEYGADTLRTYILFMGPFDQAVAWDTNGLIGVRRFLERVWKLQEKVIDESRIKNQESRIKNLLHRTIKKVTEDIDAMRFNTAIAKLMELTNELNKLDQLPTTTYQLLIKLLHPFAPHIAEELWSLTAGEGGVAFAPWPSYDPALIVADTVTIAIQVNGKLRDTVEVDVAVVEEEIKSLVLTRPSVQKWIEGKEPKKIIFIKGKLVNIVV